MSAQLSYSINIANGYAGQIFDLGSQDRISKDAEAVIAFGIAVSRGTDKEKQVLPGANVTGNEFLGISYRSLEREGAANSGAIDYKATETVGILQNGRILAVCPGGCTAGAGVVANTATGVLATLSGNGGVGNTILNGAVWESTTPAGSIGVIKLSNLTVTAGSA